MSALPESGDPDPNNVKAHQALRTFMDVARRHLDDEALSIALVSAGAGLMASVYDTEPAIAALRRAIREVCDRQQNSGGPG